MITADEFKEKYGEGNQVLYVTIPDTDGMARQETMTVKEYCQRYYNAVNPPKARLADDDKNVEDKVKNKVRNRPSITEYLKLYDKPLKLDLYDKKV